jgi:hypothetical protein
MQASEVLTAENPRQKTLQIASWGHFVGFLLIGAGMVALGHACPACARGRCYGGFQRPPSASQPGHPHLLSCNSDGLALALLLLGRCAS